MLLKHALPAALLFSSLLQSAQALEWSSIIKTADYEILVDIDSYKVIAGKPYMTTKTVYNTPQTYLANPKSVQYQARLEQTLFNCKQPEFKQLSIALLDAAENTLYRDEQATSFQPIAHGSDTFSIGQLTCQVHQMLGGQ